MAWYNDGRLHFAVGIEDTFVPQSGPGERAIDEYELTDHYAQLDGDIELLAQSGAELVRWGIPWHRVQPERDRWDWDWVDRAMAGFAARGLRPIVDLLHYGTPLWLDRQFANPDFPARFAEYAGRVAARYRDLATDYTPINEPMIHALFSGEYAYWPPYLSGVSGVVELSGALARGFVLAQNAIAAELGDRATFVHVDAGMRYLGAVDAPEHRETAFRLEHQRFLVEDLVTGRVDDAHPLTPILRANGVGDAELTWFSEQRIRPHVMGVNYYPRHSTEVFEPGVVHRGGFADPRPVVDAGTQGLAELLTSYARRYGAPVMLTETSVTAPAPVRVEWLERSVAAIEALRRCGLDVVGYTWWPLFDMYEWTYRHSDLPREDHLLSMGLWDLLEDAGTLRRRRNPVADRFYDLATHHLASPVEQPETSAPSKEHITP
jgi:beta-glucosidase